MMKNKQALLAISGIFLLLVVLLGWRLRPENSVTVGKYRVPSVSGWKRSVQASRSNPDTIQYVRYETTIQGVLVQISFNQEIASSSYPPTVEGLKAYYDWKLSSDHELFRRLGIKSEVTTLSVKEVQFRGRPALLTTRLASSRARNTTHKALFIAETQQIYSSTLTIKGENVPKEVQAEAEEAWNKFNEGPW
jgi:hypothetical protein